VFSPATLDPSQNLPLKPLNASTPQPAALRKADYLFRPPCLPGGMGEEEVSFVRLVLARAAAVATTFDATHLVIPPPLPPW